MANFDDSEPSLKDFADDITIVLLTLELIKLQYSGVIDSKIEKYLSRINDATLDMSRMLKILQSKHKAYQK